MIEELLQYALVKGKEQGVYIIARYQSIREFSIIINEGKLERILDADTSGLGIHAFTPDGFSGFAAGDNLSQTTVGEMVERAAALAQLSCEFNGEKNTEVFSAPKYSDSTSSPASYPYDYLSPEQMLMVVLRENQLALNEFPGIAVQTVYRQVEEKWLLARSDGSLASFCLPRSVLIHSLTARDASNSASTRSSISGTGAEVLLDAGKLEDSRSGARSMATLAQSLLSAPKVKGGHYKLVIEYALAKGLAHEAFGHAVESDGIKTSILGVDGKLAVGMQVADQHVSIIDGPIPGDWAYQPVSANCLPRDSVRIVDKGILAAGLGDLFTARSAGIACSGAGRAESYAHIPLPRMSNIRIEVENPLPLEKSWRDTTPNDLYELLLGQGLVSAGEEVYYLLGYKGGQVNTQHGDFVFNCSAIYKLGDQPTLCQPGIFAGKTLSALKSIRAGIGPMLTDAVGTCGKWGQGVPSSGGSHAFLLLDAHQEITLGGQ